MMETKQYLAINHLYYSREIDDMHLIEKYLFIRAAIQFNMDVILKINRL